MSYALVRFRLAVLLWGNQGKPGPVGAKVKLRYLPRLVYQGYERAGHAIV